jgi:hypothetical protein
MRDVYGRRDNSLPAYLQDSPPNVDCAGTDLEIWVWEQPNHRWPSPWAEPGEHETLYFHYIVQRNRITSDSGATGYHTREGRDAAVVRALKWGRETRTARLKARRERYASRRAV